MIAIAAVVLIAFAGIGVWFLVQSPESRPSTTEITVATYPNQLPALIYVARDRGFFAAKGLNVTIRYYDTGAASVDAMLAKEADVGLASEYVFARNVMNGRNITALGSVAKTRDICLIGRTDRGIRAPADLAGKKIGLPTRTATEYYLSRYLQLNGIPSEDVTVVNVPTAQISDALANGTVDGVVIVQPVAGAVMSRLGTNAIMWPAQGGQSYFWILTGREEWAKGHTDEITRFLEALVPAENYLATDPQGAKSGVARELGYDDAYIEQVWSESQFSLSLDQSFITAMEDEARWMIANNMTDAESIPDFTQYISTESLERVKPGSVYFIVGRGRP
nr:ABC transporter substrate-binding protein [Methanoculleus sp.]